MKDVLDEGGPHSGPLPFLAHSASFILACMIVYNAFFGQGGSKQPHGLSTRMEVNAGDTNTIVLRYDPQVEEVQRALLASGNYKGLVDGVAGQQTKLAIEAYQRKSGLAVDGQVSEALIDHLRFTQQITEAAEFTGSLAKDEEAAPDKKQVLEIQTALAELGYQPGEITGSMNRPTRAAITAFEKDRGMPESGEISPKLLTEIAKMSGSSATGG
jgi:peptidoglycan hydrolase-like protein with peptidoglycan-binding domain